MNRASGVLMHISSLPGDYSIGSFGNGAKQFIDFLEDCGFSYWQVLPFCMADECNSPYKSYSSFGGNPFFIDLPTLYEEGLITEEELNSSKQTTPYLCEFDRLKVERYTLLEKASDRAKNNYSDKILTFISSHPHIAKACEFLALREIYGAEIPWQTWKNEVPNPKKELYEKKLFMWQFIQYEFFTQWAEIKKYANEKGIKIIGDIPIYVALDSADVWSNPEQFQLDKKKNPKAVAGCPPDYFSEDGQLWGNPLYNWKRMAEDGYSWWCDRITHMLTIFDGVRIDHFRGLESYWSIPANAETAKEGKWVKGPSESFVDAIRDVSEDKLIIAEDLGDITPEVSALLEYSNFPGMRVFQFAFLGDRNSPHLPHKFSENCIAYTGTHDNNTLLGHVWELDEKNRKLALDYCGGYTEDWTQGCKQIMKTMLASPANTVIFPIQDILIYGSDTRMNTPGTAKNNWAFRITTEQLNSIDKEYYKYQNYLYSRI